MKNIHATGERNEDIADRGMEQAQNAWKSENKYNGNTVGGGYRNGQEFNQNNQDSLTVASGTNDARGVEDAAEKLYIYNDKIVATDGVDDDLVFDLSKKGHEQLIKSVMDEHGPDSEYEALRWKLQGSSPQIRAPHVDNEPGIIVVESELGVEGDSYDLNKPSDFKKLESRADISTKIGEDTMIYYQNGVSTTKDDVKDKVGYLESLANQNLGYIHNDTEGKLKDVLEYQPNHLRLQDIIVAENLERIVENGDEKNLIITHSAGNENFYKGLRAGELMGKDFDGKLDLISVASPRKLGDLEDAADRVGVNVVGQYNDWRDPVTWGPIGMTAPIVGTAVAGIPVGLKAATSTLPMLPALGPYAIPVAAGVGIAAGAAAGTAAGTATEAAAIYKYHGIEGYIDRNQGGLRDAINDWSAENPSRLSTVPQ